MSEVPHPPALCPKCGDPFGFIESRPRFRFTDPYSSLAGAKYSEWLEWSCKNCDYTVRTATADAT